MAKSILITGGARSGKSALAEGLIARMDGSPIYIATAERRDAEMSERIARHRARRGAAWSVVEEPLELCTALERNAGGPRLVDCLTLWLSNLLEARRDWEREVEILIGCIPAIDAPVVFVSNEVGLGIVPDNALARRFRDASGLMNQLVAETVDEVRLCVAGQSLKLKG